nr:hypothetical protein [Pedobacter sp. ASV19]
MQTWLVYWLFLGADLVGVLAFPGVDLDSCVSWVQLLNPQRAAMLCTAGFYFLINFRLNIYE